MDLIKQWEAIMSRARDLEWQNEGICQETDPDAFFPEPRDLAYTAKNICSTCPVRGKCIEYAIQNNEPHGIWGGLSPEERPRYKNMKLTYTNEGVDAWFAHTHGQREARTQRYKKSNNRWN